MARPLDPAIFDYAIELYLAGKPVQEIEATAGISLTSLHRERVARGIPTRGPDLPMTEIISAYRSGASELALSRQYGVSRGAISKRLIAAGVERRGTKEAGLVRVGGMTVEERKAQALAANKAARKRRVPEIEKFRRALAIEHRGMHDSGSEGLLRSMILGHGESAQPQRAIGPYNVDLAMLPVAVEVLGGGWHSAKTTHTERTPYILDAGWHLVMVWDYEGVSALGPGAADYLVTFVEKVRRNPPATCQYRVITGQGEVLAARGREDNEFPLEPPPRGRLVSRA